MIDYTNCDKVDNTFTAVPPSAFSANFPGSSGNGEPPEYKSIAALGQGNNVTWNTRKCTIKFNLPVAMKKPVFVYYRLTNFYQNHRRYVKSLDAKQLSGVARTAAELKSAGTGCEPLAAVTENGVQYPIYPCGLIANSMFNGKKDVLFELVEKDCMTMEEIHGGKHAIYLTFYALTMAPSFQIPLSFC